ncbi:hypothetical protein FG386_000178 [Cryptosporidium ryanae]|uniref:uncharacterized protein n=1 Tax=Cryptosporidium ryanae TaxID=515981 RepID=UPI00351A106C|nr:hypothetical protein FG386_000178 [Cryptosporidium ryanae]
MDIDQININASMGEDSPQEDNMTNMLGMARRGTTTTSSSSGNSMENINASGMIGGGTGLIIETTTWSRDSHELFDYEANHINNKKFLINKSSKIFRQSTECMILGDEDELPSQGDYLLSIKTTIDGKYIAFPADRSLGVCNDKQLIPKKVWLIVRDLPNKSYALQQNDLVKLGRFKLRVKQLVRTGDQVPELRLDETETSIIEPTLDESLTMQCRICLTEGEQEDDPLLCPCQCRGSIKFVHLECLRHWINGRLNLTNDNNSRDTFFFRQLQCELCKSPLPSSASIKGSRVNIVNLPKTRPPFIVLENIYGNVHRGVHVVSMAEKKDLKLGRGHESDVRISDVSISRYHATIRYRNENFMLEDHDSKFGTLVSVRRPQAIESNHNLSLQVGRTVVNLRLSDEPCSPSLGIKELPIGSPEHQNDEQDSFFTDRNNANMSNYSINNYGTNVGGAQVHGVSERGASTLLGNNIVGVSAIRDGRARSESSEDELVQSRNDVSTSLSNSNLRIGGSVARNSGFVINAIGVGGSYSFENLGSNGMNSEHGEIINSMNCGSDRNHNGNGLVSSICEREVNNINYGDPFRKGTCLRLSSSGKSGIGGNRNTTNGRINTSFSSGSSSSTHAGSVGTNFDSCVSGSSMKAEGTQKSSVKGKDFLDSNMACNMNRGFFTELLPYNNESRCGRLLTCTDTSDTNSSNHRNCNNIGYVGDKGSFSSSSNLSSIRLSDGYHVGRESQTDRDCNSAFGITAKTDKTTTFSGASKRSLGSESKVEGGIRTPPVSDSDHFLSCYPRITSLTDTTEDQTLTSVSNPESASSRNSNSATLILSDTSVPISDSTSTSASSGINSSSSSSTASIWIGKGVSTSFGFPFISSKSGNNSV